MIVNASPNTEVTVSNEKYRKVITVDASKKAIFKNLKVGTYTVVAKIPHGYSLQKEVLIENKAIDLIMAKISDLPLRSKIKLSNGQKYILMNRNLEGHEPNSATLSSEFVIENVSMDIACHYSSGYKKTMQRYYDSLNETEKKLIIYRTYSIWNDHATEKHKETLRSYFWFPTLQEYGLSGGPGTKYGVPIGFNSNEDRKKKNKTGALSEYFALDATYYSSGWELWVIDKTGNQKLNSTSSGVAPCCDISQDAYVALDSDGCYRILGM